MAITDCHDFLNGTITRNKGRRKRLIGAELRVYSRQLESKVAKRRFRSSVVYVVLQLEEFKSQTVTKGDRILVLPLSLFPDGHKLAAPPPPHANVMLDMNCPCFKVVNFRNCITAMAVESLGTLAIFHNFSSWI